MRDEDFPDEVLGFDPLNTPKGSMDPRARAKLRELRAEAKRLRPRRKPGRPRKGEEVVQAGSYQSVWSPLKREDGTPGPQFALLSCPFSEIFFGGARGGGKSLPLDELIVTPTGYRPMGEMKVGDKIHGPDGTVVTVIGVYPQGMEDVYRLTLVDGRNVRASLGHLWRVMVDGDEMTITTDYIRKLLEERVEVAVPVETLDCWVAVDTVIYDSVAHTQCIKVDSADGLFVTNDDIITHNTDGAIGKWLQHAARYGEDAKGVFFRQRFKQLEEVQSRCSALFPRLGANYHKGDAIWVFPNGANLKLRHLWDTTATEEYQGHSYSWLCFEEVTNWSTPDAIDRMRGVLRSAKGVQVELILTGNPGGSGHNWVKARYISPAPQGWTPIKDIETGEYRIYIPSRLEDNTAMMRNDPNYARRLRATGSEALVRAWLNGDWDIVSGGFFDDLIRPDRHFLSPFEIPISWTWRRSFDWGSAAPASLGIWAISDGSPVDDLDGYVFPRGSLIRVREWYTVSRNEKSGDIQPNEGLRLTNLALGNGIAQRSYGYRFSGCVADPAIFSKLGRDSIYQEMQKGAKEAGHNLVFSPADNSRIAGWQKMRDMLENAAQEYPEKPGLWVMENCTHWLRTVPVLQRAENDQDDIDTTQEDHCLVGDTMVETMDGHRPIRDLVGEQGFVRQADGSWKAFHDCRMTRKDQQTIRVTTRDGRFVTCTPDHRILTSSGWVEAKDTLGKFIVCVHDENSRNVSHQEHGHGSQSHLTDDSGISGGALLPLRPVLPEGWPEASRRGLGSREWPHAEGMARSSQGRGQVQQSAWKSRSHAWRGAFVPSYEPAGAGCLVAGAYQESAGSSVRVAWYRGGAGMAFPALPGKHRPLEGGSSGSGLRGMWKLLPNFDDLAEKLKVLFEQVSGRGQTQERRGRRAADLRSVPEALHDQQVHQDQDVQSSVQRRSEVGSEVLKIEYAGVHDVYNLEVVDTQAFAVNHGLIVHNCADDTRYICMTGARSMKVGDLSGR